MLKRNKKTNSQLTVSMLNRSLGHSFFGRLKIRLIAFVSKFKRNYREYRLPYIATAGFLIILMSLAVVRQLERTSLLALINNVNEGGSGYSTLLSTDETDKFTRNDTTEQNQPSTVSISSSTNSTQSTSTPFPVDSNSSTNTDNSSDEGASINNPAKTEPFNASIESFKEGAATLECSNPSKPKPGNCSKVYLFAADIRALNGPGSVNYTWQSDITSGSGNGSFTVREGNSITAVSKGVTLPCNKSSSFSIQLSIISPVLTSSKIIVINHNCNEL